MNPYVKEVRPLEDYQLEITFENGDHRIFDVNRISAEASSPAFRTVPRSRRPAWCPAP